MHSEQNRKKTIFPIRLLLQLVSLVLCILLAVNLLATVVICDLRALTSSGGIRTILDSLITPDPDAADPALLAPLPAANGLTRLNVTTTGGEASGEEESEEEEAPQLSADLLTDSEALAAYLQSLAQGIFKLRSSGVFYCLFFVSIFYFAVQLIFFLIGSIIISMLKKQAMHK